MPIEQVPRDQPDHPNRCQGITGHQGNRRVVGGGSVNIEHQCWNVAIGNGKCVVHGGNAIVAAEKRASLSLYRLGQMQARLEEMKTNAGSSTGVLGLRDEIALLRMKLEAILLKAGSASELVIYSQQINMTVQLIGKLVVEAKKLESSLGQLLDRQTVVALADKIVLIVADVFADASADQLAAFAAKVEEAMTVTLVGHEEEE